MNPHFQALERRIKRRKRVLNGLASASLWVNISLGVSLIYLGAVVLGLLSPLGSPWVLGLANAVVGLIGWLQGWLRPIDLAATLFQVDRALGTEEALCTYHEFSGQRMRAPFSQRLEEAIRKIVVDPAATLPLTHRQRRQWMIIGSLVLASVWLAGLGPPHLIATDLVGSISGHIRDAQTSPPAKPSEQSLVPQELQQISTKADQLEKQLRIDAAPVERRAAAAELSVLYKQLRDAQQALWKLPGKATDLSAQPVADPSQGSLGAPVVDPPGQDAARRLADARQTAQALQQALDQLKQTLDKLQQEEGQTAAADSEATQQELARLAQQAPNEEIRQNLARAAQAQNSQEQRQLISKAQQQLQDLLKQDQRLARAQQEIARALRDGGQRPSPQEDLAQAKEEASPGALPQDSNGSATSHNPYRGSGTRASDAGQGKEAAGRPDAQATDGAQDQAMNQSGGDQPGTQEGPDAQERPADQSLPAQHQLVLTHDRLPSDVQLQTMMLSKGVPFDTVSASPRGDLTLRYDFAKAESILKLRGLPLALRELIRQYFVAITAEQSQHP